MTTPLAVLLAAALLLRGTAAHAEPLRVCATLPDLASLVRTVGGDEVTLTVFSKGTEDPHFVEAKPSYVKALSEADLLVVNGLDLEVGYLSVLLQNARNARVLPGGPGYLDASEPVAPLEVPSGTVDRSMGDVHPLGNPHYWLDPLDGLRVARLVRDRLAELRPERRDAFAARAAAEARLGTALVGDALARKYALEKLLALADLGRLDAFLAEQGDTLGGWLGLLRSYRGAPVVDDHGLWPYFAHRFGLEVAGHMEPKPGIPPTTRHLGEVIDLMRSRKVRVVLASAYYDPRHADFVAAHTGARVVRMANLVGAREGTDDYLAMLDYDVRQLAATLGGRE
jgi:ABC-type Zn uptake system ZnuABC Zn-binding protein ZnuA